MRAAMGMRQPGAWVTVGLVLLAGCGSRSARRPSSHAALSKAVNPGHSPVKPPEWMLTASISGQVSAEGRPLPGAEVRLELLLGSRSLDCGQTRTGRDGGFGFTRALPGVGRLTVRAPGRVSPQVTLWLEPGANQAPALDLQRSAIISGQVTDDHGQPLGAAVRATAPGGWSSGTKAGADGRFVLDGLSPGPYRLSVEAPEHLATVEPEIIAPQSDVKLRLTRFYEVRGHVSPPRKAVIRLAGSGVWPTRQVHSTADGSFRFERVPAGVYELAAHTEDPPWAASEITAGLSVGPEGNPAIELGLRPSARIAGTVLAGGKPVSGAMLVLGQGPLSVLQNRAASDAGGRFVFAPVAGSDLRISLWARGFLPLLDQPIQTLGPSPLVINLSSGATLKGTVSDSSGQPIKGAFVWVSYRGQGQLAAGGQLGVTTGPVPAIPAAGAPLPLAPLGPGPAEIGPAPSSALTDASGGFAVLGLRAGELRVTVDHPDYARATSGWILVASGQEASPFHLTMAAAAQLSGRVLDERGRPLGGAQVMAREASGDPRFVDSDGEGNYRFRGLAGRVTIAATRAGYASAARSLRLEQGRSYEVDLVLEPAQGQLRGRVLDPTGGGLVGAEIVLRDEAGERVAVTRSGTDGWFDLEGIGTRTLTLEVSHPGFLGVERPVRSGQQVEVQLGYPAVLAGRVLDRRSGSPVEHFSVVTEGEGGLRRRTEFKDREGRFRLQGLRSGRLILRVDAPGFAVAAHVLRLPSPDQRGGPAHPEWVEVTVEAAGNLEGQLADGNGAPLLGASVSIGVVRAVTGPGGEFRLLRVPEGTHAVEVQLVDGRRLRTDPVVVRGGETQTRLRLVAR